MDPLCAGAVSQVIDDAAFPLVDLIRHVLQTYCDAPPAVSLTVASLSPGQLPPVFLDDPLCLVAVEAAKVLRVLARQPSNRASLVSSGGADVLLQLMHAKGAGCWAVPSPFCSWLYSWLFSSCCVVVRHPFGRSPPSGVVSSGVSGRRFQARERHRQRG